MRFARIAASGCARPRSSQPSCHPGSEGPRRILPTAQPMLDIEPDLLTLSGPQTGSRSPMLDIEPDLLTLSGPQTGSRSISSGLCLFCFIV